MNDEQFLCWTSPYRALFRLQLTNANVQLNWSQGKSVLESETGYGVKKNKE